MTSRFIPMDNVGEYDAWQPKDPITSDDPSVYVDGYVVTLTPFDVVEVTRPSNKQDHATIFGNGVYLHSGYKGSDELAVFIAKMLSSPDRLRIHTDNAATQSILSTPASQTMIPLPPHPLDTSLDVIRRARIAVENIKRNEPAMLAAAAYAISSASMYNSNATSNPFGEPDYLRGIHDISIIMSERIDRNPGLIGDVEWFNNDAAEYIDSLQASQLRTEIIDFLEDMEGYYESLHCGGITICKTKVSSFNLLAREYMDGPRLMPHGNLVKLSFLIKELGANLSVLGDSPKYYHSWSTRGTPNLWLLAQYVHVCPTIYPGLTMLYLDLESAIEGRVKIPEYIKDASNSRGMILVAMTNPATNMYGLGKPLRVTPVIPESLMTDVRAVSHLKSNTLIASKQRRSYIKKIPNGLISGQWVLPSHGGRGLRHYGLFGHLVTSSNSVPLSSSVFFSAQQLFPITHLSDDVHWNRLLKCIAVNGYKGGPE